MKNLFLLFCLFSSHLLLSQNTFKNGLQKKALDIAFYVRIPNASDVPAVLSKSNKGIILKHKNSNIQNIFNKYNFLEFLKAFPNTKTPELADIFYVKANSKNLMLELSSQHNSVFTYIEEISSIEFLLETNDYGLAWGGEQRNLDLINAKEAWNFSTGDPNVLVGISDLPIRTNHEDLLNKVVGYTNTTTSASHGTEVAGVVAANTNNNIGLSSIGYNIRLLRSGIDNYNLGLPNVWNLYQSGAKIINGSWHYGNCSSPSQIDQLAIDEMYNNGVLLIFAAGNTNTCGNSKDNPIYPASYNNVISVTSVGTQNVGFTFNGIELEWRDRVENHIGDSNTTHHLNNLVDMAAPGYAIPVLTNGGNQNYRAVWGTSTAAPHISGAAGLIVSVNPVLEPIEIESILKLTSSNLDTITENARYVDKMGAGRLDAAKAVEMAYKMAKPQNFIEVKNRDFYRNWSFELRNAPYGIKINNEIFRDSIKVDFTAKNFIEIENSTLEPNSLGFSDLSIDSNIIIPNNRLNYYVENKIYLRNNTSFFDRNTFVLEYFLKDGEQEEIDVKPNNGQETRTIPEITFNYNTVNSLLEADIKGYCNGSSTKYKINDSFLSVIERGSTTLSDCGGDEETDYFTPITGDIYLQQPAKNVFYEITEDKNGLWMWTDDNHKLFFSRKVLLSVNQNSIEKQIKIYPNPAKNAITIKTNGLDVSQILIFDMKGKLLLKSESSLKTLSIAKIPLGVYLLKIKVNNTYVNKKIIIENR